VVNRTPTLLFGWGIHGQHLFVDRTRQVVIAKFSSQALPVDVEKMTLAVRSAIQIADTLSS
jgi:hypothetical protein